MLLGIAILLSIMLLLVVYFDATSFIIPNWLNGLVLALFPIFLLITPMAIEWWWSLAMMGCFFAVGLLIFSLNIMGGGDVKLFIAIAPWLGWYPKIVGSFLFLVAISGGVLAIFLLVARYAVKITSKGEADVPDVFKMNQPMPYGLAIAYAFAYLIWTNQIVGLNLS